MEFPIACVPLTSVPMKLPAMVALLPDRLRPCPVKRLIATGADAKARWAAVKDALVKVGRGYVLEADRAALERPDPVSGIRLLPNKDAFLQARDRELLFPDPAHKKAVFPMLGGPGVVLSDALPVGTWRGAAKGKRYEVKVTPFARLPKATISQLEGEAERVALARSHETVSVSIA